jgi:hypothetical protein
MHRTARSPALPGHRHFVTVPPIGSGLEPPRRIWDVEPSAVFIVLAVLVERQELDGVFLHVAQEDRRGCREDVLLRDAARRCNAPCTFAEAIEQLLDARTRRVRERVGGSPMSELAAWWLSLKECTEGRQLAALLWSLARDPRWIVGPLLDMAHGEVLVRALRLLAEHTREGPVQRRA